MKFNSQFTKPLIRCFIGEFMGTFILLTIGYAAMAQVNFCDFTRNRQHGDFLAICIAWGVAVFLGIAFSKRNASGHLNPAVSIADTVLKKLPLIRLPIYMSAQMLSGILATVVIYGIYYEAIENFVRDFEKVHNVNISAKEYRLKLCLRVAGVFTTFPQEHLMKIETFKLHVVCFFDQLFATGLMMACALSILDTKNLKIPLAGQPPLLGAMISALVAAFAGNCGAPLNPARDLPARTVIYLISRYGSCAFSAGNYYFWIPLVACPLGAIGGGFIHKYTLDNMLPDEVEGVGSETKDSVVINSMPEDEIKNKKLVAALSSTS